MPVVGGEVRRRSKDRKDEIVAVAAELFAQRGFAAVSVDDIGAKVGITGPALYRHFRSKLDVLTTILDRMMQSLDAAASDPPGPVDAEQHGADALRRIITRTTTVALDAPSAFSVWLREGRHHDPATMSGFAQMRRRSGARWYRAEREANPALSRSELRIREEAAVAVINALARHPATITRARLKGLAVECALAAIVAPAFSVGTRGQNGAHRQHRQLAPWSAPLTRQELILAAAMPLFRLHGFAGVSIDQIGEAAGLTGPSAYRYYDNKAAILVDGFDRAASRVAVTSELVLASAESASAALTQLIRAYAAIASESADLIVVTTREAFSLPAEERRRQVGLRRANADRWVRVLAALRPDLSAPEASMVVRAMFGVIHQLVQLPSPPSIDHVAALAEVVARAPLAGPDS